MKDAIAEFEEFKKYPPKRGIPNKIFVGQCEFYRPSLSNSGYDVIEAVQCQAQDEGGEWADDYLDDATKEQIEELENGLEAVFQDWIQKYNFYPNFYTIPAADVYTLTTANSLSRKGTRNESPGYNGRRRGVPGVYLRTGRGRVVQKRR